MDIQKEREAFENHLKKMGKTDNETFSKNEDDSYQMDIIHFGWKIWQAAKAQAVPGWVSVEDKLPIDGQDVIAFDAIKHCVFKGGDFLQGYIESDTGHEYEEPVEVTHWMAVEAQEPTND
ncbi:DUF551 domain-containing protein [Acinetobacter sp.]|uniref:DUF551 domain-containing protein n=1 Tax=Acinetobacter sp. TaxID=472 RepID=UPI0035B41021